MRRERRLWLSVAVAFCLAATGCADDDSADMTGTSTTTTSTFSSDPSTTTPSASSEPNEATTTVAPSEARVEVLETFPHDPTAYTQGLEMIEEDSLIESTGLEGESTIRVVDIETGMVQRSQELDADLFGEGATLTDPETAVQLTYDSGRAFVYEVGSLRQIGEHTYDGEGWGLCLDEDRLVMSDGSDTLTLRDPADFSETGSLRVTRDSQPVENLNELECVDGDVYANIYTTDEIVRIDLDSGAVVTTIDAAGLLTDEEAASANVLNGIAYDSSDGTFLITGKYWPWMFRVRFV